MIFFSDPTAGNPAVTNCGHIYKSIYAPNKRGNHKRKRSSPGNFKTIGKKFFENGHFETFLKVCFSDVLFSKI